MRDAVTGQKGIGATFQRLREAEDSLYREVDETLSRADAAALAQGELPGAAGGAEEGHAVEELQDKDSLGPSPAPLAAPSASAGLPAPGAWDGASEVEDPELQDALSTLEEAMAVIQSDTLSVYSEMIAASSRGAPSRTGEALPASPMDDTALAATRRPVPARKRWWKFLRVQKLKPVGE